MHPRPLSRAEAQGDGTSAPGLAQPEGTAPVLGRGRLHGLCGAGPALGGLQGRGSCWVCAPRKQQDEHSSASRHLGLPAEDSSSRDPPPWTGSPGRSSVSQHGARGPSGVSIPLVPLVPPTSQGSCTLLLVGFLFCSPAGRCSAPTLRPRFLSQRRNRPAKCRGCGEAQSVAFSHAAF